MGFLTRFRTLWKHPTRKDVLISVFPGGMKIYRDGQDRTLFQTFPPTISLVWILSEGAKQVWHNLPSYSRIDNAVDFHIRMEVLLPPKLVLEAYEGSIRSLWETLLEIERRALKDLSKDTKCYFTLALTLDTRPGEEQKRAEVKDLTKSNLHLLFRPFESFC